MRSLLTDGHGLPLTLVIAGAHRHNSALLEETLTRTVIARPTNPSHSWLCLDRGYVGRRIYDHVWQIGMVPWIGGRRDERKAKRDRARSRRRVVERSHSWLRAYPGRSVARRQFRRQPTDVRQRTANAASVLPGQALNRYRRLFIRWKNRADTHLAMRHFACGLIVWHHALSG